MIEIAVRSKIHGRRRIRYMNTIALFCGSAILGVSSAQAAPQSAFNLVCMSQEKQSFRFRFDLQQRKWCMDECQSVGFIDELGDGFMKTHLESKDKSDYWSININRYTSGFWIVHSGYGNAPKFSGFCTAHPFSGFPQKAF